MKKLLKILVIIYVVFGFYIVDAGNFYQIFIIKSGPGSGIVKDAGLSDYTKASFFSNDIKYENHFVYIQDDHHINCGDICDQSYSPNETVVLIAEPDSNSFFVGWEGCVKSIGSACIISDLKNKVTDEELYNGKKIKAFFDKKSSTVPLNEIMKYPVSDSSLNNLDQKIVGKSKWQSIKDVIRKIISPIYNIYNNFVLDNKEHYLSCEDLPPIDKVKQVINEHQETLQEIEQVNPGFVFVTTGNYEDCVDKSDIVISYASHQDKLKIKEIINDKTFFGIPYRLQNQ